MSSKMPASFNDKSDENRCIKCSFIIVLEARLTELETRLRAVEARPVSQASEVATGIADRVEASDSSEASPSASPVQPGQGQDQFVTVRKKRSAKRRHLDRPGLPVQNRFSPLNEVCSPERPPPRAPLVKPNHATPDTLVIGSSIVRDVELPAATVRCYPGARAGDIEGHLRLLAERRRFRRIVVHVGGNDLRRRQSEVLKTNVKTVCKLAQSMSDVVTFSGPLPPPPNAVNDEMFSRIFGFNQWLSGWCPLNNVGFVDNWRAFWKKPGLIGRDGVHPTRDGSALLSRNMADRVFDPK